MKTGILLLALLTALPLALPAAEDPGDPLLGSSRTGTIIPLAGKRPLKSFLGNPAKKIGRIRQVLKEASRLILLQRGYLNDTISEILRNENRIAGGAEPAERRRLVRANARMMQRIEDIRLEIARIQLRAQRRVLAIEVASYRRVRDSVAQQKHQARMNTARYWIWRRKQLLNSSELGDTMPDSLIRKYYR